MRLTQYERFVRHHRRHFRKRPAGRLLEYGSGKGDFLVAALEAGIDAVGVEVDGARQVQFEREYGSRDDFTARFMLYDGLQLPFPDEHFDHVYSWFVFEHVADVGSSITEIARVLKPGGTLLAYTQDENNAYDGHCDMPWPPALPRERWPEYLSLLNIDPVQAKYIFESVFPVCGLDLGQRLESLGLSLSYLSRPAPIDPELVSLAKTGWTPEAIRRAAQIANEAKCSGFDRPAENLVIAARKPRWTSIASITRRTRRSAPRL